MTELENSSPFLAMGSLAGLLSSQQALSPFIVARTPFMGKPATPWAARHVFTTRTSMTEVMHEPGEVVPVVKVKKFVVTQPPLRTFNA